MEVLNTDTALSTVINTDTDTVEKKISFPRASSIDRACMRMHVLMSKASGKKVTEKITCGNRLTFDWGDAFHEKAQNSNMLIKAKYRRGWWRCTACNTILGFGSPPNKEFRCPHCNARREAILYHEHNIKIVKNWYLTGHPDMFVELEPGILTIVEFKTKAGDLFKKLEKPDGEHVLQLTSYLISVADDESTLRIPKKYKFNTAWAIIIYVSKVALAPTVSPLKVYKVKRNPLFEGTIKEKLLSFKKGFDNFPNDLPECEPICAANSFQSGASKDCPAVAMCKKFYMGGK